MEKRQENFICLGIVGQSGSGKTELAKALLGLKTINGMEVYMPISHTSRNIRSGEEDKKDYFFKDKSYFEENKSDFYELVEFAGNYYGLHKDSIKPGLNVIVIEPAGYCQIEDLIGDKLKGILLTTTKAKERMLLRGDSSDSIDSRLSFDDIEERAKEISFNLKINTDVLTKKEVFEYVLGRLNDFL